MQRAIAQGGPGPFRTSRKAIRAGTENFGSYSEYYGKLLEGSSRGVTGTQVASKGSFCLLIWEKMGGKESGSRMVTVEVKRDSQILDIFGK